MNVTTPAIVEEVHEVTSSLYLVSLLPEKIRPWDPGMFLQLTLERVDWSLPWPLSKPFSFASWGGNRIRLLVRREGRFTSRLIETVRPGVTLTVKYPFGDLILDRPVKYCLVAGGAGVSPFLAFLDFYAGHDLTLPVVLIHSVRRREELVSEIYQRKIPDSVRIFPHVTGDYAHSDPHRWLDISEVLKQTGVRSDTWQVVISGPPQFAAAYARSLWEEGFNNVQVERWQGTFMPVSPGDTQGEVKV